MSREVGSLLMASMISRLGVGSTLPLLPPDSWTPLSADGKLHSICSQRQELPSHLSGTARTVIPSCLATLLRELWMQLAILPIPRYVPWYFQIQCMDGPRGSSSILLPSVRRILVLPCSATRLQPGATCLWAREHMV